MNRKLYSVINNFIVLTLIFKSSSIIVVNANIREDAQQPGPDNNPIFKPVNTNSEVVPGGMVAVSYYWDDQDFVDMEFFITIEEDPGIDNPVFWAHQFWFEGGDGGYIGIQTNGYISGPVGNMLIFSIWDAENGFAGDGATCLAFGGEGVGWSCRLPLDWVEDHKYHLRVSSEGNSWWGAQVKDLVTNDEYYIGRIKVPSEWGMLSGGSLNFTEYYGSIPTCADIDYSIVTFDHPVADNGNSPSTPYDLRTYGPCKVYARVNCNASSCTHEIGIDPVYTNFIFFPIITKK